MDTFEKLINPDLYQVFLFSCPPSLPLSFARHPWFVVNKKGVISRWEVIASPEMYNIKTRWGHLCFNALPPWQGLRIFRSTAHLWPLWPTRLHGVVEGGEDSLAQTMAEFIERSPHEYPYIERYAYTGPNSNTYAQWVLDHFPQSKLVLSWNSFAKHYKR
jgi:hypothetical protein